MYWCRSSLMICRAAMLACAGELEINSSPPVLAGELLKVRGGGARRVVRVLSRVVDWETTAKM